MGNIFVYGLIDPRTLMIRYVGKTERGAERFKEHRLPQPDKKTHCVRWIRALQRAGLDFLETILEECETPSMCADAECWWIAYGRLSGWKLTNHTDGGEGSMGWNPSTTWRAAQSQIQTVRWANMSDEQRTQFEQKCIESANSRWATDTQNRAKVAEANKARVWSPEARARASAGAKRRFSSAAARPAVSIAAKARAARPEARARLSIQAKQQWADPKMRARLTAEVKKRSSSPEGRERLSQQAKAQWTVPEMRERLTAAAKAQWSQLEMQARTQEGLRKYHERRRKLSTVADRELRTLKSK